MTAIDHSKAHATSVAWFDAATERHRCSHAPRPELHQLRLALDLQIEAMLLALSAAARDNDGAVPWDRWLIEDLETARCLTTALVAEGVEPAPVSGGGTLSAAADAVELLDLVVARYTMMDERLSDALGHSGQGPGWRGIALEVRSRCRTRIEELHAHRCAAVQRSALAADLRRELAGSSSTAVAGVPGEMLG